MTINKGFKWLNTLQEGIKGGLSAEEAEKHANEKFRVPDSIPKEKSTFMKFMRQYNWEPYIKNSFTYTGFFMVLASIASLIGYIFNIETVDNEGVYIVVLFTWIMILIWGASSIEKIKD